MWHTCLALTYCRQIHLPPLDDKLHLQAIKHHMERNELDQKLADQIVEIPTHKERTAMAMFFNHKLKEYSTNAGFCYVDVSLDLIDCSTGTVADCYKKDKSYTQLEIHLDSDKVRPAPSLWDAFATICVHTVHLVTRESPANH